MKYEIAAVMFVKGGGLLLRLPSLFMMEWGSKFVSLNTPTPVLVRVSHILKINNSLHENWFIFKFIMFI